MTTQSRVYVRAPGRSAWLAVNLSAVVPGWGQMYGGAWLKGGGVAIATLLLLGLIFYGLFMPQGNTVWGLWLLLPLAGLYLGSLWDSYRTIASGPPCYSDPWYPVFLSHVLPGMGQLYLQLALWGGAFLLLSIAFGFLANVNPALVPVPPLLWAVGCGHAYVSATQTRRWGWLASFLAGLIALRLAVGSIPELVSMSLEQCIVPSRSMLPTLQVDDRILVNQLGPYQPQPQDIIVFQAPPQAITFDPIQPETLMVKRVIALPGQEVAIANGQVRIDGRSRAEPYLAESPDYQWGPLVVPPQHLFVLGDNRNASADSHVWGFLPVSLVLGRAYKIYWPPSRIQPL